MTKKILAIILIITSVYSYAQNQYTFKSYNNDNGLVDNYIETLFEDSRGFIWIGTRGGLNRFDGYSFSNIDLPRMKSKNSHIVGQHYITSITEDLQQRIWIGTLAGIYIYDLNTDTFETLENSPINKNSISSNLIECIRVDSKNNVWIGTRNGLNCYNNSTKTITRIPLSNQFNYVITIAIDNTNNLWLGTLSSGICKYNQVTKNIQKFDNTSNLPLGPIQSIYIDKNNTLWATTSNNGIFYKKSSSATFLKFSPFETKNKTKFYSALSSLIIDNSNNIWLGSYMGGVAIYNYKSIQYLKEELPTPHNICSNSIRTMLKDRHGNIWLGSHGGGISFYSPIVSSIQYYTKSLFINSIPGNIVSCFTEDENKNVWIGTDGNGFSKFNTKDKTFSNLSSKDGLKSDAVLSICRIKPNTFAIASWNGGLTIFNNASNSFSQYNYPSKRPIKDLQSIYGMTFDSKTNLLWCNSQGDGIQIFDCNQFRFLQQNEIQKHTQHSNISLYSSKIIRDVTDNSLWIIDGIRLARCTKNKVYFFDNNKGSSDGFFTSDILQTKNGKIYIATFDGLKIYNRRTNSFRKIEFNSVSFNDAKALVEDSYGNIWITTAHNLIKFNPDSNEIKEISKIWGIPQLQYFRKSAYKSSDGHLYFGGLKGFIILHQDSSYTYKITPKLFITKLFINNRSESDSSHANMYKNISHLQEIKLNHDQSFISLEFSVLNYIDNLKSKCKYKLEGFDKDWIYAENQRTVTYTNIPPGDYTFLLSTTDSEGKWIETPTQLKITVLPPWWQTMWFKILVALLFILGMFIYIILREKSIVDTNRQLEKNVQTKTKELIKANSTLLEQKNTIEEHYGNLREQQLVIEIKNSQLQEALNAKNKLITVIAHDFKNPLSTLLMYANMVKDKIISKKITELESGINSIVNSAETIYSQMVEVLEWSASKEDVINYNPINVNINILINDVISLIQNTAVQKNILIESIITVNSAAFVDPRMMSAILRNLIINSLKFTDKNGKITILVTEQKNFIDITVKDTGIGMNNDQIERILADKPIINEDLRSGFGLQICKTFINRNNGTFTITSELQKGSTFTVSVPKGEKLEKSTLHKKEVVYNTNMDFEEEDSQKKILVVDDNIEITNYLKEIFSESFKVIVAHNGKEALEKALQSLPEIIVSDIAMPEMDGKELCKELKSNNLTNHIPIILLSAQSLPHEQIDGLQHGADDYIAKPFHANILKQKVHILLKNRELLIEHLKNSIDINEKFNLPDSFDDKIIKDITSVIIKNINNIDFKVDMLAQEVGLSRSQLYRKTISVLGQSPNDYIKSLRLQQAIEMLKTGKYRISEIAYEVGFAEPGYFSSCFFEKFGVKPSDYAKEK